MAKKSLKRLKRYKRFYAWVCLSSILALIAGFVIGTGNGRSLERQAIVGEFMELEAARASLDAETNRLHVERVVAGIINCESGGRHNGLWGDGGRSYGVAQFNEQTFYRFAAKSGAPDLDWKSREDQIALLRWAVANGYGPSWSCYGKAANG